MTTMFGTRMRAIPRHGAFVRDPATKDRVPEDGALVTVNVFWVRRVRDGSISLHPRTASAPVTPAPSTDLPDSSGDITED